MLRNKDLEVFFSLFPNLRWPVSSERIWRPKLIVWSFRIIDLTGNYFQIFDFKGIICKILRSKELAWGVVLLDFSCGVDS